MTTHWHVLRGRLLHSFAASSILICVLTVGMAQAQEPIRVPKTAPDAARVCLEMDSRADICWTVQQLRAADPLMLRAEALRAKAAAAQADARLTDAGLNAEMLALQADVAAVFGAGWTFDFGAMKPQPPKPAPEKKTEDAKP